MADAVEEGCDDVKMLFIRIDDFEGVAKKPIPKGYRKAYRVPGTCASVYCRYPLNYVLM